MEIAFSLRLLQILSIATGSVSAACALIAMVILALGKAAEQSQNERTFVRIRLCFSLFLMHGFLLVSNFVLNYNLVCKFVAIATHFLLLSTGIYINAVTSLAFIIIGIISQPAT